MGGQTYYNPTTISMTTEVTTTATTVQKDSSSSSSSPLVWVATTRFSATTWQENVNYRANNKKQEDAPPPVCLYPVPQPMSVWVPPYGIVLVLEMNNTDNRIEGVGLVRNVLARTHHRVYSDPNYNRYAYVGHYRVDRSDWLRLDPPLLTALETLCFRGKGHFKRGAGITHLHRRAVDWEPRLVRLFCLVYPEGMPVPASEKTLSVLSLPSATTTTTTPNKNKQKHDKPVQK